MGSTSLPWLFGGASQQEPTQVPPAVAAVKLAAGRKEPLRSHGLIEQVGGVSSVPEEQHGRDASAEKAMGDITEEEAAQTPTLVLTEQIDLVELAREFRMIVV